MNVRSLISVSGCAAGCASWITAVAIFGACAAEGRDPIAVIDAAYPLDVGPDVSTDDGGHDACSDCEYFSSTCSADVLCPNGPFDPNTRGGAFDPRTQLNVVRGRTANDVWAVGALGAIANFDGTSWRRSDSGSSETMHALWLRSVGEIALAGFDRVYARGLVTQDAGGDAASPDGWALVDAPATPPDYDPTAMALVSGWAAPGAQWLWSTAWRYTIYAGNGLWRLRISPSTGVLEIADAVSVGACSSALPCGQMTSIHGVSGDDLWAVGLDGTTVHITDAESDYPMGTAFNSQTETALHGVWVASTSEAWAVGMGGVIRHYTGDPILWNVVSGLPASWNFNAVWGSSSSDIWAVGDAAVVVHYDGDRWSRIKIAGLDQRRPKLTTAWVPAPGHAWIGGQGVLLSVGGQP